MYLLSTPVTKPVDFTMERCVTIGNWLYADVAAIFAPPMTSAVVPRNARGREHRAVDWMVRLSCYPVVLERTIRKTDPSMLVNFIATICRDIAHLRRSHSVPAQLVDTARDVVAHALALLNIPLDETDRIRIGSRACAL
jgi:hypothetical protein